MSGALCYPPCRQGYSGNGPVCWQDCPAGKTNCGGALCVDSSDKCTDFVQGIVGSAVVAVAAIAATIVSGGTIGVMQVIQSLGSIAIDLANGICEKPQYLEFTQ